MRNLALRDPLFEDLFDFRREFDKIFNRILMVKPWGKEEVAPWPLFNFVPPVETYVDQETKKYFCKVSLPGIEPKEVQIHVPRECADHRRRAEIQPHNERTRGLAR